MLATNLSMLCALLSLNFAQVDLKRVLTIDQTKFIEQPSILSVHTYNSLITVVLCRDSRSEDFPYGKFSRECDVSQMAIDNGSKPISCQLTLYKHTFEGYPLTQDKAVLISYSVHEEKEHYVKYTILNFRDCKTTVVKINMDDKDAAYRNYFGHARAILFNEDNTFDVFYNDTRACGKKVCRLTLDAQGNKVRGPIAAFAPLLGNTTTVVERRVKKIPSSSNFILTEIYTVGDNTDNHFLISLIKPGEKVVLTQYETTSSETELIPHDVSVSHGEIRFCAQAKNENYEHRVHCELFDANGKNISNITLRADPWLQTVAVKNLCNDEFLLMLQGPHADSIMKLKSNGAVLGIANLTHFTDSPKYHHDFEKYIDVNKNEYCVTRQSSYYNGKQFELKFIKECISDSDFRYPYFNNSPSFGVNTNIFGIISITFLTLSLTFFY